MFLVKDNIDINTINSNTDDYENHEVQVVHKIDINALISINKLYNNNVSDILKIPFNTNYFVPSILHSQNINMNILIIIDPIENIADKKYELIKYNIALDQHEIRKFREVPHAYLVKRLQSYSHIVDIGEHKIDIMPDTYLAFIVINSSKPINLECHIECKNNNIINQNILPTSLDPEYRNIIIDNKYTYIIDSYNNTYGGNDAQPRGFFDTKMNSYFKILSTEKSDVVITYVMFDILTIDNIICVEKPRAYLEMKHTIPSDNKQQTPTNMDKKYYGPK